MRDLTVLPAKTIMGTKTPEALFSRSLDEAKKEYRGLIRRWHPDAAKAHEAQCVLKHIVNLYHQARERLSNGNWNEPLEKIEEASPGLKKLKRSNGSVYAFEYLSARSFELGMMYIGNHSVLFEVRKEYSDLFARGRRQISRLTYANEDMAVEMSPYLPRIQDCFSTDGANILILHKTPDQLLLADVCTFLGGNINPVEHVGWILSVLYNLCCYLEWAHLTHNAIAQETFFISPLRHSGMLLGGWWYSSTAGEQLYALPDRTIEVVPSYILESRRADARCDLELIKALGRELLSVSSCDTTFGISSPGAETKELEYLSEWLTLPSSSAALEEYSIWKTEVLRAVFGPPKFFELNLDHEQLYKEI